MTMLSTPTPLGAPLGLRLRDARTQAGLTQAELAARLSVSATYLSHIESGRRMPREAAFWRKAAQLLGMPRSWFDHDGGAGGDDDDPLGDTHDPLAAIWALYYAGQTPTALRLARTLLHRIPPRTKTPDRLSQASRIAQAIGVIGRDADDLALAVQYGDHAIAWARASGDMDTLGAALMRRSRTALTHGENDLALILAQEASGFAARCRTTLRGYLHQHMADVLSITRPDEGIWRRQQHDRARAILAQRTGDADDGSFTVLSDAGLLHDAARAATRQAVVVLDDVLSLTRAARTAMPSTSVRWQMGVRVTEAVAACRAGDVDAAIQFIPRLSSDPAWSGSHRRRVQAALMHLAAQHPTDRRLARLIANGQP